MFSAEAILFLVYILAVGNTPYGKRHLTEEKLTFTAIFLVPLTDHFDAFFNPKNASETNATNKTPPT